MALRLPTGRNAQDEIRSPSAARVRRKQGRCCCSVRSALIAVLCAVAALVGIILTGGLVASPPNVAAAAAALERRRREPLLRRHAQPLSTTTTSSVAARTPLKLLRREDGSPIPMSSPLGTLTLGYGDDGAQYFAARIAKHIVPGCAFRLVYVPELCSSQPFRSPSDVRFTEAPPEMNDAQRAKWSLGTLPFVPDILLCAGWNVRREVKDLAARVHPLPPPRPSDRPRARSRRADLGEWDTEDGRVTGVWWPRDAVRPIHRRTRRPIVVAFIQERHEVAVNEPYDVMLQATSDPRGFAQNIPTIFVPDAAQLMDEYVLHALPSDLIVRPGASAMRRARAALAMKTKAVAFMQAACWKDFYANEAIIRVALFDRIKIAFAARVKKGTTVRARDVDALGQCRRSKGAARGADDGHHNMGDVGTKCGGPGTPLCRRTKAGYLDQAVQLYSPYKFIIAGENDFTAGFVTEKLISPVLAHSVPIYLGPAEASTLFDTRRFLHCAMPPSKVAAFRLLTKHFPSGESGNLMSTAPLASETERLQWVEENLSAELDACVAKVVALDANDEAYVRMLAAPLLRDNTVEGSVLDPQRIGEALGRVLAAYGSDLLTCGTGAGAGEKREE